MQFFKNWEKNKFIKSFKKTSKNTNIHSVQHREKVLVNTGLILCIELRAEQRHPSDEEG